MARRPRVLIKDVFYVHSHAGALLADVYRTPQIPMVAAARVWEPATDVYETRTAFVVQMELAGVQADRIGVAFEEGTLRVWGRREALCNESGRHYHQVEVRCGRFETVIRFLPAIDAGGISSTYQDGMLTVTLPKL